MPSRFEQAFKRAEATLLQRISEYDGATTNFLLSFSFEDLLRRVGYSPNSLIQVPVWIAYAAEFVQDVTIAHIRELLARKSLSCAGVAIVGDAAYEYPYDMAERLFNQYTFPLLIDQWNRSVSGRNDPINKPRFRLLLTLYANDKLEIFSKVDAVIAQFWKEHGEAQTQIRAPNVEDSTQPPYTAGNESPEHNESQQTAITTRTEGDNPNSLLPARSDRGTYSPSNSVGSPYNRALAQAELELRKQLANHDRSSMIEKSLGNRVPRFIPHAVQYLKTAARGLEEQLLDPNAPDPRERIKQFRDELNASARRLFDEHFSRLASQWDWDRQIGEWKFDPRELIWAQDEKGKILYTYRAGDTRPPAGQSFPRAMDVGDFLLQLGAYGNPTMLQEIEAAVTRYWQRIADEAQQTVEREPRTLSPQHAKLKARLNEILESFPPEARERVEGAAAVAELRYLKSQRLEEHQSLGEADSTSATLPTRADIRPKRQEFPNRAQWLKQRLLERGWSTGAPHDRHRGPDRKTVEKILRGKSVRNDTLHALASSLSAEFKAVDVHEIPQD